MYAPTRAIRPIRANLPFKFSALIFFISGKDDFGRTKNKLIIQEKEKVKKEESIEPFLEVKKKSIIKEN